LGSIGTQGGGTAVHRLFACRPAAWPGPGREHHRVCAGQVTGDLIDLCRLQVAHNRIRAEGPQILRLLRVANYAHGPVTAFGQHLLQPHGNLTMSTSNDNAHPVTVSD
jgi:hypothetical protein